ncbi:MAG: hypothetical protein ACD_23C00498G0001, partial [uncultured bacterium]
MRLVVVAPEGGIGLLSNHDGQVLRVNMVNTYAHQIGAGRIVAARRGVKCRAGCAGAFDDGHGCVSVGLIQVAPPNPPQRCSIVVKSPGSCASLARM